MSEPPVEQEKGPLGGPLTGSAAWTGGECMGEDGAGQLRWGPPAPGMTHASKFISSLSTSSDEKTAAHMSLVQRYFWTTSLFSHALWREEG